MILGATGATGRRLLAQLVNEPQLKKIYCVGRRSPTQYHEKIVFVHCDLKGLAQLKLPGPISQIFCCLGPTIKQAGSARAFRAVDLDAVVAAGLFARTENVDSFHVISALGANPASRGLYNRTKGEMEAGLQALGLRALKIYRPSLLLGERAEFRLAERIGSILACPITWIPLEFIQRSRPIPMEILARSMVMERRQTGQKGVTVVDNLTMPQNSTRF
jgi:uncharacterized protein YbjT (DUF2867 family)